MSYRVRVFSHPFWEDSSSIVAIIKDVAVEELSGVISRYMRSGGIRTIVEDESAWAAIEAVDAGEEDVRQRTEAS